MRPFDDIEEQASHWLARENRGLDAESRGALDAWLEANTANRVAYLQLKAVWRRADRLAALRSPSLSIWRRVPLRTTAPVWRIAAVLALFIAVGAGALFVYNPFMNAYSTGIGETQIVRLSDGSRIQLNTNTSLATQVTNTTRTVRLDRGEAYFDVVHETNRPFVVVAGNRKITDIGTKFSVRREGEDVNVMVIEGRVSVETLNGEGPAAIIGKADDVLISRRDGTLVAPQTPRTVAMALNWRNGLLAFDQETLADVAQEFNRYNHKQLVVVGKARNIRIGGTFRANNLDVFAALIQKGLRLKVEDNNNTITVSKQ